MNVEELIEYLKKMPKKAKCLDGESGQEIHPTVSFNRKGEAVIWF